MGPGMGGLAGDTTNLFLVYLWILLLQRIQGDVFQFVCPRPHVCAHVSAERSKRLANVRG